MKMVKKLLSLALALSMLPAGAINSSAAESAATTEEKAAGISYSFAKWDYNKITSNTPWNLEVDYMKPTLNGGYNGTSGLEINIESPTEASRYLAVYNTLSQSMTGDSTYRVKLRYKGAGNFAIHFNWNERSNATSYKTESTDGDWKYVYKDITMPAGKNATYISFLADAKQHNVIDDVSVQLLTGDTDEDGVLDTTDGIELVTDPGFSELKSSYSFDVESQDYYAFSPAWKYENVGLKDADGDGVSDTTGGYAQITKKYAHGGDYAMYMYGESADGYAIVRPRTNPPIALGNSYYIEFYAMSTKYTTQITSGWNRFGTIGGWDKSTPDEKGWVKYSKTVTLASDSQHATDGFWFLLDSADEMIVDDLSIYLADESGNPTGNNLVADGTFEISSLSEGKYKFTNWTELKNNVVAADYGKYYAEPTKKEAKSGEYSMHIVYPTSAQSHHFVHLYQNGSFPMGSYLVEYYIKGKSTGMQVTMGMDSKRASSAGSYSDWQLIQKIITLETADRATFDFIGQNLDDAYIDDLAVYPIKAKDESSAISLTNYEKTSETSLVDGDFEDVTPLISSNLVAYPVIAGGKLNISWNNPKSYAIDDIKLYVDEELTRITPIDKSYGAFNEMLVYGLTNNKEYNVKLVITVDGEDYTYETTATPDNLGKNIYFGDWRSMRTETDSDYANTVVTAEKDVTGNASIRINANIPEVTPGIYGNLISNGKTLRVDTEYILKFKYKAENVSSFSVRQDCELNGTVVNDKKNVISVLTTTDGWVEKELSLKPDGVYDDADMDDTTYSSVLLFLVESATGSLWIDDVELYAIETGSVLGKTDLLDGSGHFEFADYTISEPEYELVADDGSTTAITDIAAGKIQVTTKIKNNAMGDEFKPAVIVALYNGTKLEKFSIAEKTVAESSLSLPADEFTASITVPALENNNYNIKVMYWNGVDSLIPLKANDILPEAE